MLKDKVFEKKYDFCLKTLLEFDHFQYLKGFCFYISDKVDIDIDALSELITEAGGKVVEKYLTKKNYIIILDKKHDKDEINNLKKKQKFSFNLELILDSVFKHSLDVENPKYEN